MTARELLKEGLQGVLLIVGEYRGSHAEVTGYVDRRTDYAIQCVRATYLIECAWHGHIDRMIITQKFSETVTTDRGFLVTGRP